MDEKKNVAGIILSTVFPRHASSRLTRRQGETRGAKIAGFPKARETGNARFIDARTTLASARGLLGIYEPLASTRDQIRWPTILHVQPVSAGVYVQVYLQKRRLIALRV